jgi:hypothetical protein
MAKQGAFLKIASKDQAFCIKESYKGIKEEPSMCS